MTRRERRGEPLSLVLFDIDHFKSINDRFGHLSGDQVLVQLCQLVRAQLRATDVFARWGGEGFVVLLPRCPAGDARRLAEQLRVLIQQFQIWAAPCKRLVDAARATPVPHPQHRAARLIHPLIRNASIKKIRLSTTSTRAKTLADSDRLPLSRSTLGTRAAIVAGLRGVNGRSAMGSA